MPNYTENGFVKDSTGALVVTDTGRVRSSFLPTGALQENMQRVNAVDGVAAITSGTLYLMGGIRLNAGQTVTSVSFMSAATGATAPTSQFGVIVRVSDRAVLAKSADLGSAAWNATTKQTFTFTTAYTAGTAEEDVYVGLCVVAGTPPTLRGRTGTTGIYGTPPILAATSNTGLTVPGDLSATAGATTAFANFFYAWVS